MPEMRVWFLGQEDPLEEEMAAHSSILTWRIPMDRGAWWATIHSVAKSQTWLNDWAQVQSTGISTQGDSAHSLLILTLPSHPELRTWVSWHACHLFVACCQHRGITKVLGSRELNWAVRFLIFLPLSSAHCLQTLVVLLSLWFYLYQNILEVESY